MTGLLHALLLGLVCVSSTGTSPGQGNGESAWMDGAVYHPPDFEGYFPDCGAGARELAAWWGAGEPGEGEVGEDALVLVRRGLRRFEGDATALLRWVGNTWLWGRDRQHPDAIAIMYHATDAPQIPLRSAAIYFGLSVVRPKTDVILRTLVDHCMRVDDPNDLSRVAWGLGSQREAALLFLAPYAVSDDGAVREKAVVVRQILMRELQAFSWAEARHRKAAQATHGHRLDEYAAVLRSGTSSARRALLELIERENIMLIMEDRYLADFAQAANDPDPGNRATIARLVGERWIGAADVQRPEAVNLMMVMSEDRDREVCYNAVYFGLTPISRKSTDVLIRLLEVAFADRESDLYPRIVWSIRGHHDEARSLLDEYLAYGISEAAARAVYDDMTGTPARGDRRR